MAKHLSKKVKIIIVISLIVVIVAGAAVGLYFGIDQAKRNKQINNIEEINVDTRAKNVVLMIGDGMGPNHIKAGSAYFGGMYMESLSVVDGHARTFSKNDWTTDSAASATALSAGVKVKNGQIAKHKGKNLQTMSEYAMSLDKSVGIIATEGLYGATPASFSAHSNSRNYRKTIINSQIESNISVMFGADKDTYDGYSDKIRDNGYTYVNTLSDLPSLDDEVPNKLFGTFDSFSTGESQNTNPTLAEISLYTLDYLTKIDDDGFFIMIEGSHIDKKSHSNDMMAMLSELKAFDDAVKAVVEWANADGDTMVVVTADHETGGLQFNGETKEQIDEINDKMFTRGGHSSVDVRVFFYGVTVPKEDFQNRTIDNTNISHIIRQVLS